jgi:hypothetical protein
VAVLGHDERLDLGAHLATGWCAVAVGGQLLQAVPGEDVAIGLAGGGVVGADDAPLGTDDLLQGAASQRRALVLAG